MNELIEKLAEQAGYTEGYYESDHGPWVEAEFNKEKFAELIVRECMEQVRDEVQYEYDWKLADAVTKRVMEHFGVEE